MCSLITKVCYRLHYQQGSTKECYRGSGQGRGCGKIGGTSGKHPKSFHIGHALLPAQFLAPSLALLFLKHCARRRARRRDPFPFGNIIIFDIFRWPIPGPPSPHYIGLLYKHLYRHKSDIIALQIGRKNDLENSEKINKYNTCTYLCAGFWVHFHRSEYRTSRGTSNAIDLDPDTSGKPLENEFKIEYICYPIFTPSRQPHNLPIPYSS